MHRAEVRLKLWRAFLSVTLGPHSDYEHLRFWRNGRHRIYQADAWRHVLVDLRPIRGTLSCSCNAVLQSPNEGPSLLSTLDARPGEIDVPIPVAVCLPNSGSRVRAAWSATEGNLRC